MGAAYYVKFPGTVHSTKLVCHTRAAGLDRKGAWRASAYTRKCHRVRKDRSTRLLDRVTFLLVLTSTRAVTRRIQRADVIDFQFAYR